MLMLFITKNDAFLISLLPKRLSFVSLTNTHHREYWLIFSFNFLSKASKPLLLRKVE